MILGRLCVALLAWPIWACAGALFQVPTRPGVTLPVYWDAVPKAQATLLLFPGGGGGFGKVEAGRPTGDNFLVRSSAALAAQGFHIAVVGRPSDTADLDYADRLTDTHMGDVRAVLDFVGHQAPGPVWLVGTSRGTVSATAAAIRLQDRIAGLVLSSSIVSARKPGALLVQDLAAIRVPTLLIHHRRDACPVCSPDEVPKVLDGLTHAPVKKLLMVDGGADPHGPVCAPWHWHGYVGMEREAVEAIAAWIRDPRP